MNKSICTILLLVIYTNCFGQSIEYDKTVKQYIIAEFSQLKSEASSTSLAKIQKNHMSYIKSLAKEGKLVMAGPYVDGGGLFFLNTSEESKAREWVENDPSIKYKVNSYTLKKWLTEKGLFTLDNSVNPVREYGKLNPKAPKETMQYGQFVGEWDVDVSNLTREGNWIEGKANWKFTYMLNGFAVQDYWTRMAKPNEENRNDYFGSNIRIFNPITKKWKTVWLENGNNDMNGIWISYKNNQGEIILHDDTNNWKIKFFNITKNSFDWKWDFKLEDGSMQTRVKIKAKRVM